MYIILNILGNQYRIFRNLKLKIDRINLRKNTIIILNNILFFSSKKVFLINNFFLNKVIIIARIIGHKKLKKINILKFKRRKGYKKKIGFKKKYTEILIENINLNILLNYIKKNGSKKIGRFF